MSGYKPRIYQEKGAYDEMLPPYSFYVGDSQELTTDEGIWARQLRSDYGDPGSVDLDVLDIGAGTGRMAEQVAPFAGKLSCTDKNFVMLDALEIRLPQAQIIENDTYTLASRLEGESYDLVSAHWTLSYPIGERLETIVEGGIEPREDFDAGVEEAKGMVRDLVGLAREDGQFVSYFFDSESPEQQAVTKLWEQIAPDPGGRRSFTREIAEEAMKDAAQQRGMDYSKHSVSGVAEFESPDVMEAWYSEMHCKGRDFLVNTPTFKEVIDGLKHEFTTEDDRVELPVGMHILTVSGLHKEAQSRM